MLGTHLTISPEAAGRSGEQLSVFLLHSVGSSSSSTLQENLHPTLSVLCEACPGHFYRSELILQPDISNNNPRMILVCASDTQNAQRRVFLCSQITYSLLLLCVFGFFHRRTCSTLPPVPFCFFTFSPKKKKKKNPPPPPQKKISKCLSPPRFFSFSPPLSGYFRKTLRNSGASSEVLSQFRSRDK